MVQNMKVLLLGNNPNIQFYTSRFQSTDNIELFHVSDTKSNIFHVETKNYGKCKYSLDNHFTSIENLIEGLKHMSYSDKFKFDLIILNVTSLKQLATLSSRLNPIIDSHSTSILIESSGVLPLEDSFTMNDSTLKVKNIFSLITNYDIREMDSNQFKQYNNNSTDIIIGQSSYSSLKSVKNSNNNKATTTTYNEGTLVQLKNLQQIFIKIFNMDEISTCNMDPTAFISKQWSMAIPNICLDPLMILFQELDKKRFLKQILAKPLISGLITEILTIARTINIKLSSGPMDNENNIINTWNSDAFESYPQLIYNFLKQKQHLNFDLLLLQPILLADDHGIKTPYLEFLYTIMIQYDKIISDQSIWFITKEKFNDIQTSMNKLNSEKQTILNDFASLKDDFQENNIKLHDLQSKIDNLEMNKLKLEQEKQRELEKRDQVINDLQSQLKSINDTNDPSNSPLSKDPEYKTPSVEPFQVTNSDNTNPSTGTDTEKSLYNREKQLLEKEIELKKRELELEKNFAQKQQQQQLQQPLYTNSPQLSSPAAQNLSPIFTQQGSIKPQHLPYKNNSSHTSISNGAFNRSNHSTPTLPNASASKFIDPIASGLSPPMDMSDGFPHLSSKSSFGSHPIKPTSRKNRKSNMPMIGNASSIGFNDVSTQNNVVSPGAKRISSMPLHGSNFHSSNSNNNMSEMNGVSKQGLGIDMPQPNRNGSFGINNSNNNSTTNIGAMSTPVKTPMSHQPPTTKPIQFGSNNGSSNNALQFNNSNNTNTTNSSSNTPQLPQPIQFGNNTPSGNANSSTPVDTNHTFGQPGTSSNTLTTNTTVDVSEDTEEKDKKKSKKKFGGLFKRNKK